MNRAGEHSDFPNADQLISRVVDGDASDADWNEFRAMAERTPSLWRELAEFQRDHVELTAHVQSAIAVADGIEAPAHEEMGRRFSERLRTVAVWGGWAAAACLALVWYAGAGALGGRGPDLNQSGLVSTPRPAREVMNQYIADGQISPTDLREMYLDAGQQRGLVLGQDPDLRLISARPMKAGGGYEVTYVRRIMERARVKDINGLAPDEFGRPYAIPLNIKQAAESGRY